MMNVIVAEIEDEEMGRKKASQDHFECLKNDLTELLGGGIGAAENPVKLISKTGC